MELMTPEGGTIFWTAVTFVVLAFILYKVGWKPILNMLEERELRIKESIEKADLVKEESERTAIERQQQIDAARKEANEILNAARQAAETIKNDIDKTAHAEADKMIERAKHEIELSREILIQDIRTLAIELSMDATEKLISKKLTKDDHQSMVQAAMDRLEQLN